MRKSAPSAPDPLVAEGLVAVLQNAPDRATALEAAVRAIEHKLVGDRVTVAQLLDAITGITVEERTTLGTRPTAIVSRLNPGAQRTLVRALRALG